MRRMPEIKYPNGLNFNAARKSPWIIARTALDEPHEGQGVSVTFRIRHTSISWPECPELDRRIASQA